MPPFTDAPDGRGRPADRRAHLLDAAAVAFSERGFHGTRLADVAEAADVSAPALYRHFTNKSDLLGAVVRQSSERLHAALHSVEPDPGDPAGELHRVIDACVSSVLTRRRHRDLYRWESAALNPEDLLHAQEVRRDTHVRIRDLIRASSPDLTLDAADTLARAVYTTASSPQTHRVTLPRKMIVSLIGNATRSVAATPLPVSRKAVRPPRPAPTARREAILAEAVALFAQRGFHEVPIEQIAAAAGIPASGVYRYFSSKQAILAAALQRASDRTEAAMTAGLAEADSCGQALSQLTRQYAQLCVDDPSIITAYRRCFGAIDDAERTDLRRQQRLTVNQWAGCLREARPELPSATAQFLVHAALDVINDLTGGPQGVDADTAAALALQILLQTPAR